MLTIMPYRYSTAINDITPAPLPPLILPTMTPAAPQPY